MKIFIGMINIGSLMGDYAKGFRDLGHEVFSVQTGESCIQSRDVDLNIPEMVQAQLKGQNDPSGKLSKQLKTQFLKLAWEKALEADMCFFIWESFMPDASDIRVLKKMGKKIVVRFCGSEVRDPDVYFQSKDVIKYPYVEYDLDSSIESLEKKLRYLRTCECFADLVICPSEMSLRPIGTRQAFLFDSVKYAKDVQQKEYPILLHAPSKRSVKGTDVWVEVFDVLRSAGLKFGTRIVEGLPHEYMAKEYAASDIFCDSLWIGGRSTWEAMAGSCIPVGRRIEDLAKTRIRFFKEFIRGSGLDNSKENQDLWLKLSGLEDHVMNRPGVNVTLDTVVEEVAQLILDYPRRQKIAKKCYDYATKKLSPVSACKSILDYIENPNDINSKLTLVHTPFFNKFYTPTDASPEKIALFNKYTNMVRYCPWYKKYVEPCERGGLKF